MFDKHDSCSVHTFSDETMSQIEQELTQELNSSIEDLLFGDDFFDEDSQEEDSVSGLLAQEVGGYTNPVVFAWPVSWPIEMLREILPDSQVILYIEDPSVSGGPGEFMSWSNKYKGYADILLASENQGDYEERCYITNAESLQSNTSSTVSEMFAWCGLNEPSADEFVNHLPDYDTLRLSKWCSDDEQELLKLWGFFQN